MNRKLLATFAVIATLALNSAHAQTPTPIAVKAEKETAPVSVATSTKSDSMQAAMKSLQEMKAANEQILKKQQATLAALDELQKAADQIKIFSKRG